MYALYIYIYIYIIYIYIYITMLFQTKSHTIHILATSTTCQRAINDDPGNFCLR